MGFTSIPPQKFRLHMLYNEGGDAVRLKIWFPKQQRLDIYVNGLFMNPNNLDFSADDYNLLPPDPAVHVPALTEPRRSTTALSSSSRWTGTPRSDDCPPSP